MNFQSLLKVENPDFYLDLAFKAGHEKAGKTKTRSKKQPEHIQRKFIELDRIKAVVKVLTNNFKSILDAYPHIDNLDEFYKALVKVALDYDILKKSLGAVAWCIKTIQILGGDYDRKLRKSSNEEHMMTLRTGFYGRVSSVVKQIKNELAYLEESRKAMKKFPTIKTSIPTVVIAGFPNVGKSTLLKALTGAEPKIASYPFTTQRLMLGYYKNDTKIQFIDTPGLLDRLLEKRNKIELHAVLALKYLAKIILFVIDPTESCGYSIPEQLSLLKSIDKNFQIHIIIAVNKIDIIEERAKNEFKNLKHEIFYISADKNIGIKELTETVLKNISS